MILALMLAAASPQTGEMPQPSGLGRPATPPSAEAMALGRRLADAGPLATLLPMVAAKETDDLVKDHPDLSAAEQARLRLVAGRRYAATRETLLGKIGEVYARTLSIVDLRQLVAMNESDAARHYRAALPVAISGAMAAMQGVDVKAQVLADYCAATGKLCAK